MGFVTLQQHTQKKCTRSAAICHICSWQLASRQDPMPLTFYPAHHMTHHHQQRDLAIRRMCELLQESAIGPGPPMEGPCTAQPCHDDRRDGKDHRCMPEAMQAQSPFWDQDSVHGKVIQHCRRSICSDAL